MPKLKSGATGDHANHSMVGTGDLAAAPGPIVASRSEHNNSGAKFSSHDLMSDHAAPQHAAVDFSPRSVQQQRVDRIDHALVMHMPGARHVFQPKAILSRLRPGRQRLRILKTGTFQEFNDVVADLGRLRYIDSSTRPWTIAVPSDKSIRLCGMEFTSTERV